MPRESFGLYHPPPRPASSWTLPKMLTCGPDLVAYLLNHLGGSGLLQLSDAFWGLVPKASANSPRAVCLYPSSRFMPRPRDFGNAAPMARNTPRPVSAQGNRTHARPPSRATMSPYGAFAQIGKGCLSPGGHRSTSGLEGWPTVDPTHICPSARCTAGTGIHAKMPPPGVREALALTFLLAFRSHAPTGGWLSPTLCPPTSSVPVPLNH